MLILRYLHLPLLPQPAHPLEGLLTVGLSAAESVSTFD